MSDNLLLAVWRYLLPLPSPFWKREVNKNAGHIGSALAFLSPEHQKVRNFVVQELPRQGRPLTPQFISNNLQMPIDRVMHILEQLEHHMTFLYRNTAGEVTWAYPVTVEPTPHRLRFSTGEKLYAA